MTGRYLIYNATIVTGEREGLGAVAISGERIEAVLYADNDGLLEYNGSKMSPDSFVRLYMEGHPDTEALDMTGIHLFAGGIDAHVHFREPGMTHKADMASESLASVAGGVTSFIDMPNTRPATVSVRDVEEKLATASGRSHANFGFHIGATNDNISEIKDAIGMHAEDFGGVKVFMGSSTGNMLVDSPGTLASLFSLKDKPVLVHAEDERTIRENMDAAKAAYGEDIPFGMHPAIRSRQACIRSSAKALEYAMENGTKLHLLHISTKEELEMVRAAKAINQAITAETSANYLWFCDSDYKRLGSHVKCNPSIKGAEDRQALREALRSGLLDTIGSDHAPHLLSEKEGKYPSVPSGMPSIQQSFEVLLTVALEENIPLTRIASVFSEKTAGIFHIKDRGLIKAGYYADIVAVDLNSPHKVMKEDLLYKCGWSPYEGETLLVSVRDVFVNGHKTIDKGKPVHEPHGQKISFGY